jgi:hypothetical protein
VLIRRCIIRDAAPYNATKHEHCVIAVHDRVKLHSAT